MNSMAAGKWEKNYQHAQYFTLYLIFRETLVWLPIHKGETRGSYDVGMVE